MAGTQTSIENPQQFQPPKSHWHFHLPWWAWVSVLIVVAFGVGYWAWSSSLFSTPPMIYEEVKQCDVDQDGACDESDKKIIESLLSICAGARNFNALADGNHDGCITLQDIELLFPDDETHDWNTYRNEEYGFEFRHPEDWTHDTHDPRYLNFGSDPSRPLFTVDAGCIFATGFEGVETENTHEQVTYGAEVFESYKTYIVEGDDKELALHILDLSFPEGYGETHGIPENQDYYKNVCTSIGFIVSGDLRGDERRLQQILSTFRFIESPVVEDRFSQYINKSCSQDSECGGFPCVNGSCLVKKCQSDGDCPNNLCGLNLTPVPGYCTSTDVK